MQMVKDAHQQIHVPQTSRKRRMSASAVIMQHPFAEKPRGPALHGLDAGQLTDNKNNETTSVLMANPSPAFMLVPFHSLTSDLAPGSLSVSMSRSEIFIQPRCISSSQIPPKALDVFGQKLENLDKSNPVNHIHLIAEKVRRLRIDVDWSKLFVIDKLEFKRNIKLYPSTTHNITFAVRR